MVWAEIYMDFIVLPTLNVAAFKRGALLLLFVWAENVFHRES